MPAPCKCTWELKLGINWIFAEYLIPARCVTTNDVYREKLTNSKWLSSEYSPEQRMLGNWWNIRDFSIPHTVANGKIDTINHNFVEIYSVPIITQTSNSHSSNRDNGDPFSSHIGHISYSDAIVALCILYKRRKIEDISSLQFPVNRDRLRVARINSWKNDLKMNYSWLPSQRQKSWSAQRSHHITKRRQRR